MKNTSQEKSEKRLSFPFFIIAYIIKNGETQMKSSDDILQGM